MSADTYRLNTTMKFSGQPVNWNARAHIWRGADWRFHLRRPIRRLGGRLRRRGFHEVCDFPGSQPCVRCAAFGDASLAATPDGWGCTIGEALDEWADLRDWVRDADHHPGCLGGYGPQYRCKCGLRALLARLEAQP